MRKGALLGGTVLALILAGPMRPAGAEWFLDLYGGGAFTQIDIETFQALGGLTLRF